MANPDHLKTLEKGVSAWNDWRRSTPDVRPDLRGADLRKKDLRGVDLCAADLREADLCAADLRGADLSEAILRRAYLDGAYLIEARLTESDLTEANLRSANLTRARLQGASLRRAYLTEVNLAEADLSKADLIEADLTNADLSNAVLAKADLTLTDLRGANLEAASLQGALLALSNLTDAQLLNANLSGARLKETVLTNLDMAAANGLDACVHFGPSSIDHRTLERSRQLPLPFLRGVGLPDAWIEYLPSLVGQPFDYYSCFISYSSKDEAFAQRLHADLQDKGVRCWFAPEDMKIGDKTLDTIDEAIRLRDKILLILSEHSIASEWVEDEVTAGYEEERKRDEPVLFPIRLDDAVMDSKEAWAAKLRRNRHIGDFRNWKNDEDYQEAFERLLRDLKRGTGESGPERT